MIEIGDVVTVYFGLGLIISRYYEYDDVNLPPIEYFDILLDNLSIQKKVTRGEFLR